MPAALGGGDDVARLGVEVRNAFDLDADRAFHHHPELGPADVEMALFRIGRHFLLGLAAQDVGREVVVPHELAAIGLVGAQELLVIVHIDRVGLFFLGRAGQVGDLDIGHALDRIGRDICRIDRGRADLAHFKAQRRNRAGAFQRVHVAEGHVHHEALGGGEGLIAVDRHLQGALADDEDDAVIGPHLLLGRGARRHRDIVGLLVLVAHDGLHEVGFALVHGLHVRQLPVRAVRRRVGRHRAGLGRQEHGALRKGADGVFFLAQELGGSRNRQRHDGGSSEIMFGLHAISPGVCDRMFLSDPAEVVERRFRVDKLSKRPQQPAIVLSGICDV